MGVHPCNDCVSLYNGQKCMKEAEFKYEGACVGILNDGKCPRLVHVAIFRTVGHCFVPYIICQERNTGALGTLSFE